MADHTLEILVSTKFDRKGTEEARQGLAAVAGGAGQVAAASGKEKEAVAAAAKEVRESSGAHQEMRRAMNLITQEAPLMGLALKAIVSPTGAAIMAGVMAFQQMQAALTAYDQKLQETADSAARADFLPSIEAKRSAMMEAIGAAARFAVEISNLTAKENELSNSLALGREKIREMMAASAELRKAREAEELAKVDLRERQDPTYGGAQAIADRAAIRKRYRKQGEDAKSAEERSDLEFAEAELKGLEERRERLKRESQGARAEADSAKAKAARGAADVPGAKQAVTDAMANAVKAGDELQSVLAEFKRSGISDPEKATGSYGQVYQEKKLAADLANNALSLARRRLSQAERDAGLQGTMLPQAEGKASVAETQYRDNESRILALQKEVARLRELMPIRSQGRSATCAAWDQAEGVKTMGELAGSGVGQTVIAGAAAEAARQAGQQLTAGQNQALQALMQLLNVVGANNEKTLSVLAASLGSHQLMARRIADLEREVRQTQGQVLNSNLIGTP